MSAIHEELELRYGGVEVDEDEALWRDYYWLMATVFEELGYEPSEGQKEFHMDRHRVRMVAGGERAGKSYSMAMDGLVKVVWGVRNGVEGQLVWILGPDYEQPRVEFEYMYEGLQVMGFQVSGKPSMPRGSSSTWVVEIMGMGVMQTKTTSDLRKIASRAPDLVMMSEAAQMDVEAFYKIRGRAAEKKAPVLMSGTFEDSNNWYAERFKKWLGGWGENKSFSLPTWSNLVKYPGGYDDPEIVKLRREFPPDLFMERFGAIPHKPHTLIFPEFEYGIHVGEEVEYDPGLPVELAIDPGYDPGYYHVSAMQVRKGDGVKEEVWVVDEIHVRRWTAEKVIRECKRRVWWKSVVGGVIDIAGRAHVGDRSQVEIWRNKGRVHLRSQPVGVTAGIERHRTFLLDPETGRARMKHSPNCVMGLREYGLYKRPVDQERMGLRVLPIDRDNHAMKSYAYYLYDRYGAVERVGRKRGRAAVLGI